MAKSLLGLLLLLASVPALADNSGPHWLEVRTPNFTILSDASEKDARHIAVQLERMRAVFHVLMPSARDDAAAPVLVVALRDKKSFRTLEPAVYLGKNALDLAGLFMQAQDKNYVLLRLDAEGDHPFATVYHEYTHYMLRKSEDWIPVWLNEGLAEFYQNTDLQDKDIRVGEPNTNDILYLRQFRLMPLTTLLAVDHSSPYYHDQQKGSVFYAEAWALTHFIEISDKTHNTNHLEEYASLVKKHEDPVVAAQKVFGDLKKLESSLNAYIQGNNFQAFKLVVPVTFPESSFQVQSVASPQADAMRAAVLLEVGRHAEAQTLLANVLQADPNNALAHETMGTLKFRQHDLAGAEKWYGEAVQLDSRSYLAHYYFAAIALQQGDRNQDDACEKSLKTAIVLNPKFAPSYDALAHLYASRHEKYAEAHMLNLKAVQLEPENLNYRINAAWVLQENEQVVSALSVLKAAQPLARTPEETEAIGSRISQLERYQASLDRSKQERAAVTSQSVSEGVTTSQMVTGPQGHAQITVAAETSAPEPVPFPADTVAGPHHTLSGVLHGVQCSYPAVLTLTLNRPGKPIQLYTNNYYKVLFTTGNYEAKEDIVPCTGIEGMKARIEYAEVTDTRVVGRIVSIELSK